MIKKKLKTIDDYVPILPRYLDKENQEQHTQVEALIRSELQLAFEFLQELKQLNGSFFIEDKDVLVEEGNQPELYKIKQFKFKSKHLAMWICDLIGIVYSKNQTLKKLEQKLSAVFFAFRRIGTHESLVLLFQVFLNVDVTITAPEAGVIEINLKDDIKTDFVKYIVGSVQDDIPNPTYRKIIVSHKQDNGVIKDKFLVLSVYPADFGAVFYYFLKRFIPIGRVLRAKDKNGVEIQELKY